MQAARFDDRGDVRGDIRAEDLPGARPGDGVVDVEQFVTGGIALDAVVEQGLRDLIDHEETDVTILVQP